MNRESVSPSNRHRRYTRRRLDILRSAAAAFSRKGFSAVTMEEIADRLDLTKGSLYYYFNSKQDLLYFCQQYSLDRLLQEARRITGSGNPETLQLFELILTQVRCMLGELQGSAAHAEFRALSDEQLAEIIRRRDQYESILRSLVAGGIRKGLFYPGEVRVVVWAILGAVNWTVQWYSPTGELSADDIGHEFAMFLVRGLTRPEHLETLRAARGGKELPAERGTEKPEEHHA